MTLVLYPCTRLSASITQDQCHKNRNRIESCKGCPGLRTEQSGTVIVTATPEEELAMHVPVVTLRFEHPEDRELYQVLCDVCHDLEYDIISLLHMACSGNLLRKG